MKHFYPALLFALALSPLILLAQETPSPATEWQYTKWTDPMTGGSADRFVLEGRYIAPPSQVRATPSLVVACVNGKYKDGTFRIGAVAQPGAGVRAHVQMRFDERAKVDDDYWEVSNDGTALFFGKIALVKLMTSKMLGHPSDSSAKIHLLTLGVAEAFASEVVVRFEMPPDSDKIVEMCSLDHRKR